MGYSPQGRKEWDMTERLHFLSLSQVTPVPTGNHVHVHTVYVREASAIKDETLARAPCPSPGL